MDFATGMKQGGVLVSSPSSPPTALANVTQGQSPHLRSQHLQL